MVWMGGADDRRNDVGLLICGLRGEGPTIGREAVGVAAVNVAGKIREAVGLDAVNGEVLEVAELAAVNGVGKVSILASWPPTTVFSSSISMSVAGRHGRDRGDRACGLQASSTEGFTQLGASVLGLLDESCAP